MNIPGYFYTFLCGSHAVGWCLVALRARERKFVDLCQFVRAFILAPFFFALALLVVGTFWLLIWKVLIPNMAFFLLGISIVIGAVVTLGAVGYFAVVPVVKKAYGIAKPFSEKICIVLYRSN